MFNIQERKVLIIGVLSLIVAVVTYGLLDSTGTIDNELGKFGGAITGFLAAAALLNRIYGKSGEIKTISGTKGVSKEKPVDSVKHDINHKKVVSKNHETVFPPGEHSTGTEKQITLPEDLEIFFKKFEKGDRDGEEYCEELLPLLNQVAGGSSEKKRLKLNKVIATLVVLAKDLRKAREDYLLDPTNSKKERIHTLDRQIMIIINDLRYGELLTSP
ncbi:MAG: hypothetical protein D6748_06255 [Calditrichaeota bacterium]|nr:MAG: hypothetical protein D6748_06255 [Calditrichota bacterium]